MDMKIIPCQQRSDDWHHYRSTDFTASEFDGYCLEPRTVTATKDDLIAMLDALGIPAKKTLKKEDLIALHPDPESLMETSQGAMTAILKKIQQGKVNAIRRKHPDERTEYEAATLEWADEVAASQERAMSFNIAVRRGNMLEPEARFFYEQKTGFKVDQPGYIQHDTGGFGCSPDGLIEKPSIMVDGKLTADRHGLEIKCPMPETHMAYLLAGTLPSEYKYQVHGSMAVTGLDRWDFLSYCPGEAPLLLTVLRDEFTDRLERGLIELVAEKKKIEARLAQIWMNAYA